MFNNKPKGCIVYETTLEKLQELTKDKTYFEKVVLYEKDIDRSNISPEQAIIQKTNNWYRNREVRVDASTHLLMDVIKDMVDDKVFNGFDGDIEKEVADKIYSDTDFKVVGLLNDEDRYDTNNLSFRIEINGRTYGETDENRDKFAYDIISKEEFEKRLEGLKTEKGYGMSTKEYIWLERVQAYVYCRDFCDIHEQLKKLIKKYIRENLRYCLRNRKVIVPQEYLDKKEEGILEWQKLKESKNKNNSIEKKMIRQAISEKKQYAYKAMTDIMLSVSKANDGYGWSCPSLTIDGVWSKTRTTKLVNKLLSDKTNQELIEMSKKEIVEMFKNHWKGILDKASELIDDTIVSEED